MPGFVTGIAGFQDSCVACNFVAFLDEDVHEADANPFILFDVPDSCRRGDVRHENSAFTIV